MNNSIQQRFFELIKQKLDPNISLVNAIADVLELSNDSAYRRLRNETALSLDESVALANHFNIDFNEFITSKSDAVLFTSSTFRDKPEDFISYLESAGQRFGAIASAKEKFGIYAAKDIPTFFYFQVPEFGQFKLFYWLKTIRGNSLVQQEKFNFGIIPDDLFKKVKMIARSYFQIPMTELWSEDTVNVALRQIEYFYEAGWMENQTVAIKVCDALEQIIRIVQKQAQTELTWFDDKPVHPDVRYELYFNDIAVMDNAIYMQADQSAISMIGYNAMDYLLTQHPGFCNEAETFLKNQIAKSVRISGASEKERNMFFNKMYSKIAVVRKKIQSS